MKEINSKQILVFIILSVIVFGLIIFYGDYNQISKSLHLITAETILILIFLAFLNYVFRFLKWQYFLGVLDIKPSLKNSLLIFFSGLSMSITPGKVGEVLKSYLLKETDNIRIKKSIMIIFAERLTDVIGLVILSLLGISSFFFHFYSIVLIIVLIVAIIVIITNRKIFFKLSALATKFPLIGKYVIDMEDVYDSSRSLMSLKSIIFSILISIVSWFFECLALYVLLLNLNSPLSISQSTFIFAFSSIFGSILVLPGGLGAAEGSFLALLIFSGISKSIAALATIVIRISTLWFGVLLGLISLFVINRKLVKK